MGVRRRPGQTFEQRGSNWIVTAAPEALRNPDDVEGLQQQAPILYAGSALVVPSEDQPGYGFVAERGGNHVFRAPARPDRTYRYMLAAGWSEGEVLKTPQAFADYVAPSARAFSSPLRLERIRVDMKP